MVEKGEEEDKADLIHLLNRTHIEPEVIRLKVGNEQLTKRFVENDAQQNMSKPFKMSS